MTTGIQPSAGAATAAEPPQSVAQQKAQLQKLVAQYAQRVGQGATADALAALGKTIKADAKALGVNVTLPASQTPPAQAAPSVAGAASVVDIRG